jgi:hypothetical protein
MAAPTVDPLFQDFCREIHFEPSPAATPATIAVEYQRLFQADRTWVLLRAGSGWSVRAVGGIPGFQRRADVVRKLENFVSVVARTGQSFAWTVGATTDSLPPRVCQRLDEYLDEAHVCQLRVELLLQPSTGDVATHDAPSRDVNGIVICEWFQPPQVTFSEGLWVAARQQAALAVQNATDWSAAPLANLLRHWRRRVSWRVVSGRTAIVGIVILCLGIAAMIPLNFTIDATGELHPVRRRHVFATTAGIVRSLAVSSGVAVSKGALLLELDNPELELEIRRIEGERQTVDKRITALEASRLDFGLTSADSASQINSLAGELKEQRQKRENFRHELESLEQRRDDLKVLSPIQGRVVTWDLERLLLRRPVARGQRLLTISDTEGPWELELQVRDEDTHDLMAVMQGKDVVPIDFITVTMPDRAHATKVKSVSKTVEIRSSGDVPSLLCRADVPEDVAQSAVEGMGVRGRIHCGRRTAAYVLLNKMWRSIREHILFPCGW